MIASLYYSFVGYYPLSEICIIKYVSGISLRSHFQLIIYFYDNNNNNNNNTIISIFYVNDSGGDRAYSSLNIKLNLYVFY
jgi:hypothetical protein